MMPRDRGELGVLCERLPRKPAQNRRSVRLSNYDGACRPGIRLSVCLRKPVSPAGDDDKEMPDCRSSRRSTGTKYEARVLQKSYGLCPDCVLCSNSIIMQFVCAYVRICETSRFLLAASWRSLQQARLNEAV